ncbi:hypothetical protein LV89_02000 [Arcicella aurantiaca]|uniref:Uncharacterized protein n=1 Tax=Arcicella aurantiaca TaxID=591202 RepID=A0A316ECU2_9BACT|nr:hypothetical protein [Arcicella aurantiaca]PWK27185.1 hypothetical protein LV89_02000 [Arcicella aurantiaca]
MHPLRIWLNGEQDFDNGFELFRNFGGSQTWLKLFEKLGSTTYTRIELHKQIGKLLDEIDANHIPKPQVQQIINSPQKKPLIIQQIEDERKANHKEAIRLHHTLVLFVEESLSGVQSTIDAKKTVFSLRSTWNKIDEAWKVHDDFEAEGKVPEVKVIKEKVEAEYKIDLLTAADRRRTLKTYLSPSYLKRIPEVRRALFVEETKKEIEKINEILAENESTIFLP